jgi:hypothetical protein
VVQNVYARFHNDREIFEVALEIGNKELDSTIGGVMVDCSDRLGEVIGSIVWLVVTIDRGDNGVLEFKVPNGAADPFRFVWVKGLERFF